jgi:hypothetical protein
MIVFVAVWMLAGLSSGPVVIAMAILAASVGLIGAGVFGWRSVRDAGCPASLNSNGPAGPCHPGPLSRAQHVAHYLTLASVASLVSGPLFILICYLNGDIAAFLPHRRKLYPVSTMYELGYDLSLLAAISSSFFALAFAPTWKRAGLLIVCIVALLGFWAWLDSLHG